MEVEFLIFVRYGRVEIDRGFAAWSPFLYPNEHSEDTEDGRGSKKTLLQVFTGNTILYNQARKWL